MASGRFIPFAQYTQDLTRSMSGLCQVFPSRHVALTIKPDTGKTVDDIIVDGDTESDKVRLNASGVSDINYGAVRNVLYKTIFKYARYLNNGNYVKYNNNLPDDVLKLPTMPAMGELNFISHEVQGGWMYNDIYVHIPTTEIESTIRLQETALESRPDKTGFEFNVETGKYSTYSTNRSEFVFNAVVIYYNLHMIDPQSKTADTQPVVIDMPMGIYFLDKDQTIQKSNSAIFDQGTAWSTRIVSRIATGSTVGSAPTDRNNEYGTLARVLSEFGDIADTMNQILHRREVINAQNISAQNPASINLSPEDIKAFLEEFRQKHAVNVPYIKDNCWFVNGRNLGPAFANFDWKVLLSNWFDSLSSEDLAKITGPAGKDGADGAKGEKGDIGPTGATGKDGIQGPAGIDGKDGKDGIDGKDGKDGKDGATPIVGISDDCFLTVNGAKIGPCLKGKDGEPGIQGIQGPAGADGGSGIQGPQGNPGNDGKDGHSPVVVLNNDCYLEVDGVKTGPCLKGENGETPNITVSDDCYLMVNGVKTGPCLKGEQGDSGLVDTGNNGIKVNVFGGPTNLGNTGYKVFCNGTISHINIHTTSITDSCKEVLETAFKVAGAQGANVCNIGGATVGYWIEFMFANASLRLAISSSSQLEGIIEWYCRTSSGTFEKITGRIVIRGNFSSLANLQVTSFTVSNAKTDSY